MLNTFVFALFFIWLGYLAANIVKDFKIKRILKEDRVKLMQLKKVKKKDLKALQPLVGFLQGRLSALERLLSWF